MSGIKDWQEDQRPRERLLKYGPERLSNAELLAILIGGGTPEKSAVALMEEVLETTGDDLLRLGRLGYEYLLQFKGIGQAKAVSIMAACEISRRRMEPQDLKEEQFNTAERVARALLRPIFDNVPEEQCYVLMFDNRLNYLGKKQIGVGGLTSVGVDKRKIVREALLRNSNKIILSHNHPSGNPEPSRQDDALTEDVLKACRLMDIQLVDHIIVARKQYYSYAEHGKL